MLLKDNNQNSNPPTEDYSIKQYKYRQELIGVRPDRYVNLTDMCRASNMRLKDFLAHPRTLTLISTMYISNMLKHRCIMDSLGEDTWGHMQLAKELAYQSDAKFNKWFISTFYDIRTKPKIETHIDMNPFLKWTEDNFPWLTDVTNETSAIGRVYFILNRTRGILKVGYTSNDPKIRLSAFRSGAVGESLVLVGSIRGTREAEAKIHSCLSSHRFKGEWFSYVPEVQSIIINLLKKEGRRK